MPTTLLLLLATFVVLCLFVSTYAVYKPPAVLIRSLERRWPDVLWRVRTEAKTVALTIDDGPSAYTAAIGDLLDAHGANATFFLIGAQLAGHERVLERLVRAGNELGNHAMHDEPSRALADATLVEQIHSVEEMVAAVYARAGVAARAPRYFRPGSGFFSKRMRHTVARLGYRLVLGSIYPHDAQIAYWRVNVNHILSMLQPGGIIICHDRRSWTLAMLKELLPKIRERGYRIVTVTQLLQESGA